MEIQTLLENLKSQPSESYESEFVEFKNYNSEQSLHNAKDLADLSILISKNNSSFKKYPILNTISDEIDLLELAKLISKKFHEVPVFYDIKKDLTDEVYSECPKQLRLISKELNYGLKNIDEQIIDTILGLKNE